jgi:superfamily II DNA or RNA helicase
MSMLDAMRAASHQGPWSQGVRLARAGNVFGVTEGDDEIVIKVVVARAPVPLTVHLWPEDEDWSCDCPSETDVCPHAAAAVIAWAKARRAGKPLPKVGEAPAPGGDAPRRAGATIGYRLARQKSGLYLTRVLVRMGRDQPFRGSLLGRQDPADGTVLSERWDLEIEQALSQRVERPVTREVAPRLLHMLSQSPDVQLDGEPVRCSKDPVVPIGRVDDDGDGFKLRIVRDRTISEVFANGVVRCGDALRPVSKGGLKREQYQALSKGIHYRVDDVQKLVADAIPALRQRIPVEIRTKRLPEGEASKPRLMLSTVAKGDQLVVKPVIVYGEPPVAMVERGELTLLGSTVPIRDRRIEDRLVRESGARLGLPVGLERAYNGESAVAFVAKARSEKTPFQGEGWKRFLRTDAVAPTVRIEGETLDVDLGGADPRAVIDAWMSGSSLVRVKDGWAPLPEDWLSRYGHLVADLLAARDEEGKVARHALFDLARLAKELDQPPPPRFDGLETLLSGFEGIPEAPLPADLTATLRPYQREGVNWLSFLRDAGLGGILADDMGLGKTLQALCAIPAGDGQRTLVVAPTSVLQNWRVEAEKFRPSLSVCVYHGPGRKLDRTADLVLTTYGVLRIDVEKLSKEDWDAVVLDEAQAIKNPESQVARAAYRMDAPFRLTLTGTPVENRLEELWSQLHFLNRGLLGGRRDFSERYSKPIAVGEPGVARRLRQRIKPFVLRRMKKEVARDLPPRTDMTLHCTLSASERDAYDAVRAATYERVVQQLGEGRGVMAALEALLRLRQAACHTGLLPGQHAETSSKIKLLIETLDEVVSEGHKALVFSQWTALLDRVEPHLRAAGQDFVRLDGTTRDRQSIVDRFQDPDGPPVFLISLRAGGTGLNLTAADHVFLLDPWWNPAVEDQAADRAHRIGQDKPVMVYRVVADDTVEERILALQDRKRALAEAALGEAGKAGAITRDELLALLV